MLLRPALGLLVAVIGSVMGATGVSAMPTDSTLNSPSALAAEDTRAKVPPRNLDTHRTFPTLTSREQWEARRNSIRQHILVSCGLYPLPPKTPLKPKIFDRVVRDGYTIEKVYFQTYPGFYLAGNLYRPLKGVGGGVLGVGQSPVHPGILVAHGHWGEGRMADTQEGSISARAITFARQGCVAFTYDMVGYNDTHQIDHQFANDSRHWLWGVSLMGLQTWNSIRALDFIASLPDVDKTRLAITGESGGGTQTMMLGAIEDRLAAVGPCVMVSHTMQGGCLCENAPGLRVDFSNMEVAAAAAPRVQVMVGAIGDWTTTTMTVEGPAVASVYKLYGAEDHLKYVLFNYGHNINKTSREAVYSWFGKWLLHENDSEKLKEPPYKREPVESLLVFPTGTPLPKDAKTAEALSDSLILLGQTEVERRKPHDKRSLTLFQKTFRPAWEHTLGLEFPTAQQLQATQSSLNQSKEYDVVKLNLGREGRGDNIPALMLSPAGDKNGNWIVLVHPKGKAALMEEGGQTPSTLVKKLLAKGYSVLLPDLFLTGERANANAEAARHRPFGEFFSTYNLTDLQERVQDLVTLCAYLRKGDSPKSIALVGLEQAGLWTLLAAPAANVVAADCAQFDLTTDDGLLTDTMFVPGLRRLGDFRTAATLAAPHPLLLHNTGSKFTANVWMDDVYKALNAAPALRIAPNSLPEDSLVSWLTTHTK